MAKKKTQFPKTIIVTREGSGAEEYLNAYENGVESIEEERDVAVYRLEKVSRLKITKEIE